MSNIIAVSIVVILVPILLTIIYRLVPFKHWETNNRGMTLFPKYLVNFDTTKNELETSLKSLGFTKLQNGNYSRGKSFGDFSIKAVKLTVAVNEKKHEFKIFASTFGILFDTGDIWQVTSDILD